MTSVDNKRFTISPLHVQRAYTSTDLYYYFIAIVLLLLLYYVHSIYTAVDKIYFTHTK